MHIGKQGSATAGAAKHRSFGQRPTIGNGASERQANSSVVLLFNGM
jgi:hypothetical protein